MRRAQYSILKFNFDEATSSLTFENEILNDINSLENKTILMIYIE